MALFLARFGPHADKPETFRQALRPHLDYLEERRDRILLSATMRPDEAGAPVGFVWLIEAEDRAAAERLCHDDPFWIVGLRTSFELFHLTKALPDRMALV